VGERCVGNLPLFRLPTLGSSVRVAGIALPGWEVSAVGVACPTDSQGRFSNSATAGGTSGAPKARQGSLARSSSSASLPHLLGDPDMFGNFTLWIALFKEVSSLGA